MTGALILHALLAFYDVAPLGVTLLALGATVIAGLVKLGYWRFIDRTQSASTAESATGLGALGKVRLLESPHSGDSYIQREMGFRVARKHARSEEHTSELQSLMRISYAVFCLKKKKTQHTH